MFEGKFEKSGGEVEKKFEEKFKRIVREAVREAEEKL